MQTANTSKRLAPGVYQIIETGGHLKASIDRLLADGTMLSSPENSHLFATIDAIIQAECPAAPTTVGQRGTSIPLMASSFGLLVQWMKVRGIHYFGHLTDVDLRSFIYDSSCGLDAVVESQKRLQAVFEEHNHNNTVPPSDLSAALIEAGIPSTQSVWLPAAKAVFNEFVTTGEIQTFRAPSPKQVSTGTLWARAKTFQHLWNYRDQVVDGLSFEPSLSDIAKHTKRFGKQAASTRTLPVDYTCTVVSMAFTWLYEYGPLLADVQRVLANQPLGAKKKHQHLRKTLSDFNSCAQSNGWPIQLQTIKEQPRHNYFSWQIAAGTFLPVACFVICGIFTARRISELVSFSAERLNGNAQTGYWVSSYVGKRAKYGAFPCTQSVADSIRALTHLMEQQGVDNKHLAFSAIRGSNRLSQRLRNGLARFGKLARSDDAEQWQLAPHQFRRMFALIYRWRYDHPSLIALSVYFGHVNLKHIGAYTNSKEWKRDYQQAGKQFTLEKLRDVALGKVEPKGIFGKSLQRAVSRSLSRIELADESEQVSVLSQLIEHRQLDLRATLWGYCGVKSAHSNLRRAACTTNDNVRSKASVDPEKSSEEKCAGCLFFCTDNTRKAHWLLKSERLRTAATSAPEGSIAKRKMQDRQSIIERFARNNFQDFHQ